MEVVYACSYAMQVSYSISRFYVAARLGRLTHL